MAIVKISQLPEILSLTGGNIFPVVASTTTYKVTLDSITNSIGNLKGNFYIVGTAGSAKIGINQASPSYDLDVTGAGRFTGQLIAQSVSGSFSGSGADLYNIPASGIVGLNLSRIVSGSVTASVGTGLTNTFSVVSGSNTLFNITKDGNVWIGNGQISNLGFKLEVSGSSKFNDKITVNVTSSQVDAGINLTGTRTITAAGGNSYIYIDPTISDNNASNNSLFQFLTIKPSITSTGGGIAGTDNNIINVAPTFTTALPSTDLSILNFLNILLSFLSICITLPLLSLIFFNGVISTPSII